jgi:hypothetical protein
MPIQMKIIPTFTYSILGAGDKLLQYLRIPCGQQTKGSSPSYKILSLYSAFSQFNQSQIQPPEGSNPGSDFAWFSCPPA